MSRSIKKTLHYSPCARTHKEFKQKSNRSFRRKNKVHLKIYDDGIVFSLLRECSDLWVSPRDGFTITWYGTLKTYRQYVEHYNHVHKDHQYRRLRIEWWRSYFK